MKNLFYSTITLVIALLFVACDPIEDTNSVGTIITSADQIEATVTPVVIDGQNTNKVIVHCTSPVVCQWTDGISTYTSNNTEMLLLVKGTQTINLSAKAADGTIFEKEFSVNVENMHFEVPAEYGYFCGSGEKVWTWADSGCFGNGGGTDAGPAWWILNPEDIAEQCSSKGLPADGVGAAMTFTLKGLKMTKTSADGTQFAGNFKFDMNAGREGWSLGTVTFAKTNILCGYDFNAEGFTAWSTYHIIYLDDEKMILGAQEHAPNSNYWYWVFKAL